MDVSRMVTAAACVPLLAGCGLLAWRCRSKGLIGRRRALALAGAALCALAAAACLCHSFLPRVHYVQQEQAGQEASQEAPQEAQDGAAAQVEGGRVTYSTASLGVEPASSSLPEREAAQDGPEEPAQADGPAQAEEPAQAAEQPQEASDDEPAATSTATTAASSAATASTSTTTATSAAAPAPQAGAAQAPAALDVAEPSGTATVEVIEAGAACCLVTLPDGSRALVDAGASGSSADMLARLSALGAGELDALVLTSCDDASMGGAAELLSHVRVARVVLPAGASGELARAVSEEASRTGASLDYASSETPVLSAGSCEVAAVPAGASLVARVSFGGRVAALSACATAAQAAQAVPGRVDVLACGSADADSARAMWPAWAACSSDGEGDARALAMAGALGAGGAARVALGADGSMSAQGAE